MRIGKTVAFLIPAKLHQPLHQPQQLQQPIWRYETSNPPPDSTLQVMNSRLPALINMAEMITPLDTNDDATNGSKPGRHSRFTSAEDLIIVREVAAARAHMAPFGEVRKRFEGAAAKANINPSLSNKVTWKTVQDRYKRLQDQFDKADNENHKLSGVGGGEMEELTELLMSMREARDDMEAKKDAEKNALRKKEEDKERMGQTIVLAATKRKRNGTDDDDEGAEGSNDGSDSGSGGSGGKDKKRRKTRMLGNDMAGEMERFGAHLKESDLAKVAVERERLEFERFRYDMDRQERDTDRKECREDKETERVERREEREQHAKLELEKFKLMMQAFTSK